MALKYAKDYLNSCGVTSYYLEQEKIVLIYNKFFFDHFLATRVREQLLG